MDFHFITIAAHKKRTKNTTNYGVLTDILLTEIQKLALLIKIVMDSNPNLYKELSIRTKIPRNERVIFIKQAKSHTDNMLQIADYIVNISAQKIKKKPRANLYYRRIASKCLRFIELE